MIERDQTNEVWAIPAPGGGNRAFCDRMNSLGAGRGPAGPRLHLLPRGRGRATDAVAEGFLGMPFGTAGAEGAGPVAKNIGPERTAAIREQLNLDVGDAVFFVAGNPDTFTSFAGAARDKVGHDLELIDEDSFALAWIVDFPMYEWNEEEKKIDFSHNPVLHAAGRAGGAGDARPARHHRRTSTTSSATATRSRRAPSATTRRRS